MKVSYNNDRLNIVLNKKEYAYLGNLDYLYVVIPKDPNNWLQVWAEPGAIPHKKVFHAPVHAYGKGGDVRVTIPHAWVEKDFGMEQTDADPILGENKEIRGINIHKPKMERPVHRRSRRTSAPAISVKTVPMGETLHISTLVKMLNARIKEFEPDTVEVYCENGEVRVVMIL